MCGSVLQEVVRLVMPVVRRKATLWVLADVVAKALGAMLPKTGAGRVCNAGRCELRCETTSAKRPVIGLNRGLPRPGMVRMSPPRGGLQRFAGACFASALAEIPLCNAASKGSP